MSEDKNRAEQGDHPTEEDGVKEQKPAQDQPTNLPGADQQKQFLNWRLIGWIVLLIVAVGLLLVSLPT